MPRKTVASEAKEFLRILNRRFVGCDGGPTTVGAFTIDSMKPGTTRLYQVCQVTNENGGVKVFSPWMTASEFFMFARGMYETLDLVHFGGWRYL